MGEPLWRLGAQLTLILLTYSSLSGPKDKALGVGCHSPLSVTWGKATAHRSGARPAVSGGVKELTSKGEWWLPGPPLADQSAGVQMQLPFCTHLSPLWCISSGNGPPWLLADEFWNLWAA